MICILQFWKKIPCCGLSLPVILSVVVFLRSGYKILDSQTKSGGTCREVEKANPQLHDLLNCAVELDEKSKSKNLSFMEKRVLETTEREANSIAWEKGTRPNSLYWVSVLWDLE